MKPIPLALCMTIVVIANAAVAQTKPAEPRSAPSSALAQDHFELAALDKIIGLDLKNGDKQIGEIDDLIVDPTDGSIDFAVVSEGGALGVGEDRRLVPWQSIQIRRQESDKDDLVATTTLTEERIKAAPTCKKGSRIDGDLERKARETGGVREPMDQRTPQSFLSSAQKVKGASLKGSTEDSVGKVDDVLVDLRAGKVAYVVLGTGGALGLGEKQHALPFSVMQFGYDADQKLVLTSPLTKDRLAKGPEYDSKDIKRMGAAPYMRDLYSYYSVDPYWNSARAASSPLPGEKRKDERK